ncbi:hypothetical protein ABT147_40590 [Streptomyces sp. NPDC001868]|uniref:hypothetical protein n=1 Tax=Streptomyces sp. NPDC001868 TaxID=3154401 RepID=UPI00331F9E34
MSFPKDADAALALQITPATLSCFLSGKKEVPERGFVRRLHEVLARREGRPVDPQALEHSDELYMAALAVLQPLVWKVHNLTDQRNAARQREQVALTQLHRMRTSLETAERDATALRRDLRRARKEQEAFASQTQDLLEQLRQAQVAADEAVVAEAIRIAEQAAVALSARRSAARTASRIALISSAVLCVAGIGMAVVGPSLTGDLAAWLIGGAGTTIMAVLAGIRVGRWRRRQLQQLGVHWDWAAHALAISFAGAIAVASLVLLAIGVHYHQDALAHRLQVTAAVSECTKMGTYRTEHGEFPFYDCTYEWTLNGVTFAQRDSGLKELEGKTDTVLVDPTKPDEMVPERIATHKSFYWLAAAVLFALGYPGFKIWELWESVSSRVQDAVKRAEYKEKARVSAMAG